MTEPSPAPYWLSGGFRPFFLLGALAMALSILAWLPLMLRLWTLPTAFSPRDWHVHSMLLGAVPAIVAGFALTAVSNWTGRPPVAGRELLVLVLLWLAGRAAIATSSLLGPAAAAALDLLFPIALVAVFAREVVKGGNLRNLRVVALVALLGLANASFHLEAALSGAADYSLRAAIAVVLVMIMLVGGRIIPAFTRNWLAARGVSRLPAQFSRLDAVIMACSALALLGWVAVPGSPVTAVALLACGALNACRLARWRGLATRSEPLLAILHVGFAMLPLGFLAVGMSILAPGLVDPTAGLHVWTVGTIGTMTIAVMTRASRGHSGQALHAGRLEIAIYALILLGAASRVLAPYVGGSTLSALEAAGLAWALGCLVFVAGYAPMLLLRPRMHRR